MKSDKDEANQDEATKRSPWQPMELRWVGDINKVVQVDPQVDLINVQVAQATPPPDVDISDRDRKEHFAAVDEREILSRLVDIPIESWNYKGQNPSIRHIGPMAQDFAAAFGVGEDDKHINTVDANGVTMAAIKGLYQMIREKDAQIDALRAEVDALKQLNSSGSVPRAIGRPGRRVRLANQR